MRLNQVTIAVQELDRSIAFYVGLGLELIVRTPPRYARFRCPDGDATFSVHVTQDDIAPGAVTLYFECDDLDARVAALEAKGYVFRQQPVNQAWLWKEAYLVDPDGHVLCLFYAGKNRLDPPWRIRPAHR